MLLNISTHSGNNYEVFVEMYNAEELNEKLNDANVNTIVLGDVIVSRIDVKTIVPTPSEN